MSKKTWIFIILIVVFVGVGVVQWRSEKTYVVDVSEIEKINVSQTCDNVKIQVADNDKIEVCYYEGLNYSYEIKQNDQVLDIAGIRKIAVDVDLQDATLVIKVPSDCNRSITINTDKRCFIDKSIRSENITINSDEDL